MKFKVLSKLATLHALAAAVFAASFGTAAYAQGVVSTKPLRVIVPYPAGGALDNLIRRIGAPMAESTGHPVIVDNRPGGLTNIAMQACSGAAPDGYTVCFTLEDSTVYNALLFKKLPYDPETLTPVINLATSRPMLVASAGAPFASIRELVAYEKANPGKVNFGTWGPASSPDLYRQWMNTALGIQMVGVPYRGVGTGTMPAIMSGEIQISMFTIGQIMPHIQSGKVKPVAIMGDKKWPGLPNVGTLADEKTDPGLPSVWAIYAPPGTPVAQVNRLNAEFNKALRHPSVVEFLQSNTLDPVGGSPEDFSKALNELRTNAKRVFRTLNIQPTDQPS